MNAKEKMELWESKKTKEPIIEYIEIPIPVKFEVY